MSEALGTNVCLRLLHEYAGRNHVYLDDRLGVVVKKFSSGDGAARCELEVAANDRMRRAAPVPEILAFETDRSDSWMAMRRLRGTLWQELGRQRRQRHEEALWREAGQMLAKIHRIHRAPGVPTSRASQFYRLRAERALSKSLPHHELILAARQELRLLDGRIGELRHDSLVHRDFSPRNILVAGRDSPRLSGLIDFERARMGDPTEDFGMVLFKQLIGHHTGYLELERAYFSHAPPIDRFRDRVLYHLIGLTIEIAGWALEKDAEYYRHAMLVLRSVLEDAGAAWGRSLVR